MTAKITKTDNGLPINARNMGKYTNSQIDKWEPSQENKKITPNRTQTRQCQKTTKTTKDTQYGL